MANYDGNTEIANAYYNIAVGPNLPAFRFPGVSHNGTEGTDNIYGSDPSTSPYRPYDVNYGADTLSGLGGNDYINGRGGHDSIDGGAGSDTLYGGSGFDTIFGGDGDDRMFGEADNDRMNGNAGNDQLDGGAGDDTVRGGQGDDLVVGGAGNDFVSGDLGYDTLSGGAGADTFDFASGSSQDVITDFNRAEGDHVQVAGSYTYAQEGANVVVHLSDGSALSLANVQLSSLTAGWIVSV